MIFVNENKERWRNFPEFEDRYLISDYGRVKRKDTGYIRKTFIDSSDGYLKVSLYKNKKLKSVKIHRAVAIAFIPNPNELPCVNHKDENKANPYYKNLEWCTHSYNINYGTRNESMEIPVAQYSKDGQFIKRYKSMTEAAKSIGKFTSLQDISKVVRGKRKTAAGFVWKEVI